MLNRAFNVAIYGSLTTIIVSWRETCCD